MFYQTVTILAACTTLVCAASSLPVPQLKSIQHTLNTNKPKQRSQYPYQLHTGSGCRMPLPFSAHRAPFLIVSPLLRTDHWGVLIAFTRWIYACHNGVRNKIPPLPFYYSISVSFANYYVFARAAIGHRREQQCHTNNTAFPTTLPNSLTPSAQPVTTIFIP